MKRTFYLLLVLAFAIQTQSKAQKAGSLLRSTPEAEGVSSSAIATFLDSVAASKHEFHSFMLLRHGKVIAEGWWNPYRADLKHTLYSLSKSFTATAVGFAKAEGLLALSDKVRTFFPTELPDTVTTYQDQLTVKDLLTMSVGQEPDPTGRVVQDRNWVKRFFTIAIKEKPGTKFLYNSAATYMLSAIVQKVTGKTVLDYLQPRLFDPLAIIKPDWEQDGNGINTGGWGLRLQTEDIAKFAQLFLQKGVWNGKQLLPAGWAEEASAAHIIQHPEYTQAKRDSSDWEQGYGYQMWRCRNNAFRGDGAFGQYAIVLPEQDAVIAITSETADMQGELNLIWKLLLPAMKTGSLPGNKKAAAALQQKLAVLSLPVKKETINTAGFAKLAGKKWQAAPNPFRIQSIAFTQKNSREALTLTTDTASYTFLLGANAWQAGETTMHGPYLVSGAVNSLNGLPPFKVASEFTWIDNQTLEVVLRYIESPHTETVVFRFNEKALTMDIKRSFNTGAPGATATVTAAAN